MNKETLNQAVQAFWQVIASQHPEIKTGDLEMFATVHFENECEQIYKTWLESNQPAKKD